MSSPTPPADAGVIQVRGAREHNLKGVDLDLPRGALIVFSGVSGSGKSSLAFDTLFAEGQRRYVESLSAYARQFLGQLEKPRVTSLKGLSPTIAIEQKTALRNPRSTVGTITEILDFLRVLFARVGALHCHVCGRVIQRHSAAEIVAALLRLPEGTRFALLAPLARRHRGDLGEVLDSVRVAGFARVRVDGKTSRLEEVGVVDAREPHDVDVVIDRLVASEAQRQRITDSVETALKRGDGVLRVEVVGAEELTFSERLSCAGCGTPAPELTPQLFSFNHPSGMCPACSGLGTRLLPDMGRVIPDPGKTLAQGAVAVLGDVGREGSLTGRMLETLATTFSFSVDTPWRELPPRAQELVLYGAGETRLAVNFDTEKLEGVYQTTWEGAIPTLMRRLKETRSEGQRTRYLHYLSDARCDVCHGARLRPEALAVRLGEGGLNLPQMLSLPLEELARRLAQWRPEGARAVIAGDLLREVSARLGFLNDVGVGYLSLDRAGPSLSGGEAQRIRLASQIGSELTGVLYVLDEPSIGLHPRDTSRLLDTLRRLRDLGNTVLVVEHDEQTLRSADWLVDFGPGAGVEGGEVLYQGELAGLLAAERSLTGGYLSGRLTPERPARRRPPARTHLRVVGAREHNLKGIDVAIPLSRMVAVTGVSGAGKSSLVRGILAPALAQVLQGAQQRPGLHGRIEGLEHLEKVIEVDQSPIGRSPRSNPATYTGAFDLIRALFAETREARVRGYGPERFSFNARGGRCEVCEGEGARKVEMHFLPDVFVPCDVCGGRRFNEATLAITFKGLSIADVLEMPISQAWEHFKNQPRLSPILECLKRVGLGYLSLGQSATTLSGGEAQRLKLARELARPSAGRTFYILDEPTTGLHFADVERLLAILEDLVLAGNTVLVVEHDLQVIARCDHVIDLGPDGGEQGGEIVAEGTPEEVARAPMSHTGRALRGVLGVA